MDPQTIGILRIHYIGFLQLFLFFRFFCCYLPRMRKSTNDIMAVTNLRLLSYYAFVKYLTPRTNGSECICREVYGIA